MVLFYLSIIDVTSILNISRIVSKAHTGDSLFEDTLTDEFFVVDRPQIVRFISGIKINHITGKQIPGDIATGSGS